MTAIVQNVSMTDNTSTVIDDSITSSELSLPLVEKTIKTFERLQNNFSLYNNV